MHARISAKLKITTSFLIAVSVNRIKRRSKVPDNKPISILNFTSFSFDFQKSVYDNYKKRYVSSKFEVRIKQ
jgi:hypothetical protein